MSKSDYAGLPHSKTIDHKKIEYVVTCLGSVATQERKSGYGCGRGYKSRGARVVRLNSGWDGRCPTSVDEGRAVIGFPAFPGSGRNHSLSSAAFSGRLACDPKEVQSRGLGRR